MFGLFKTKAPKQPNCLYLVLVKVGRGANNTMPSQLVGAVVPVFAPGTGHEQATRTAVSSLVAQGFEFKDIQGPISRIDPYQWDIYVRHTWPEFMSHLPDQNTVLGKLASGQTFYGPFAGYE